MSPSGRLMSSGRYKIGRKIVKDGRESGERADKISSAKPPAPTAFPSFSICSGEIFPKEERQISPAMEGDWSMRPREISMCPACPLTRIGLVRAAAVNGNRAMPSRFDIRQFHRIEEYRFYLSRDEGMLSCLLGRLDNLENLKRSVMLDFESSVEEQ